MLVLALPTGDVTFLPQTQIYAIRKFNGAFCGDRCDHHRADCENQHDYLFVLETACFRYSTLRV